LRRPARPDDRSNSLADENVSESADLHECGGVRAHRTIVATLHRGGADESREAVRADLSGTLSQVDEIRQRFPAFVRG